MPRLTAAIAAALSILVPAALAATNPCAALRHATVPASEIALPTNGATVRSARLARSGGAAFCKVLGTLQSIDPSAQPIRFEVNLPESWNHKALQYGGASFDGYLAYSGGLRPTVVADRRQPTPLARGYATFGSDSGHHHRYLLLPDALNVLNSRFALNDEQRRNFASEQLKKTHDAAIAIMKLRYGQAPRRTYFIGGSTGGREAMMVVDRWPADYDGVLAAYAAWNQIESDLQFIRIAEAEYNKQPGDNASHPGYIPKAKTRLLHEAVLSACDAADGLRDGIVSDPASCRFDPATLRCPDGRDHKGCLSDAQENTVSAFSTTQSSTFDVQNGIHSEPGYNVLSGADLTGEMGIFRHPFHPPIVFLNSFYYLIGDGVLRFFLTKDPHFNALAFDSRSGTKPDGGTWVPGILKQSAEDDASLADLTPFASHGGKLLLIHGTVDLTLPTNASVFLYQRIVDAMGSSRADSFLRLYLIPGYNHGYGTFNAGFDIIGTLDAWADQGIAPANLIVTDQNKPHGSEPAPRSRPLCAYPAWPRYTSGDPNLASSFTCATTPGTNP
jgi:feruloyl esterase